LSGARLGFYDRRLRRYLEKSFRGDFELLSCSGNVSWKEGGVFAHLHAVLGDRKWRAFGGHLCPGSTVFVAEVRLQECPLRLERVLDPDSGLFLWPER
jgi:predicted DNA-binding protein with PD1-like motif